MGRVVCWRAGNALLGSYSSNPVCVCAGDAHAGHAAVAPTRALRAAFSAANVCKVTRAGWGSYQIKP